MDEQELDEEDLISSRSTLEAVRADLSEPEPALVSRSAFLSIVPVSPVSPVSETHTDDEDEVLAAAMAKMRSAFKVAEQPVRVVKPPKAVKALKYALVDCSAMLDSTVADALVGQPEESKKSIEDLIRMAFKIGQDEAISAYS